MECNIVIKKCVFYPIIKVGTSLELGFEFYEVQNELYR